MAALQSLGTGRAPSFSMRPRELLLTAITLTAGLCSSASTTALARPAGEASFAEATRMPGTFCFVSTFGIEVSAIGVSCPAEAEVDSAAGLLLWRTAADANALEGVRLLVTGDWIECGGAMTFGCSSGDTIVVRKRDTQEGRLISVLSFEDETRWERVYAWERTLAHEFSHVLRTRAGLSADQAHRDRTWWRIADAPPTARTTFPPDDPRTKAVATIRNRLASR